MGKKFDTSTFASREVLRRKILLQESESDVNEALLAARLCAEERAAEQHRLRAVRQLVAEAVNQRQEFLSQQERAANRITFLEELLSGAFDDQVCESNDLPIPAFLADKVKELRP